MHGDDQGQAGATERERDGRQRAGPQPVRVHDVGAGAADQLTQPQHRAPVPYDVRPVAELDGLERHARAA